MGKLLRIFGFPASRGQCVIVLAGEFVWRRHRRAAIYPAKWEEARYTVNAPPNSYQLLVIGKQRLRNVGSCRGCKQSRQVASKLISI